RAVGTAGNELAGAGEPFADESRVAVANEPYERLEAEHALEVDCQQAVGLRERDEPRHPALVAQRPHRLEQRRAAGRAQPLGRGALEPPAGQSEHEPAGTDSWQEGRVAEHSPVEVESRGPVLVLEPGEEAIDGKAARAEVVSRGEPRHDPPAEPARPEDDA